MMLDMIPDVILDLAWIVIKIVAIILPMTVAVAYFTYAERRVIGEQIGSPNQVEAVMASFEKRDPVFAD